MGANIHPIEGGLNVQPTFGPRVTLYASVRRPLEVCQAHFSSERETVVWHLKKENLQAYMDLRASEGPCAYQIGSAGFSRSFSYLWISKEGTVEKVTSTADIVQRFKAYHGLSGPLVGSGKSRFDRILEEEPEPKKPTTTEDIDQVFSAFEEELKAEKEKADNLGILNDFLKKL